MDTIRVIECEGGYCLMDSRGATTTLVYSSREDAESAAAWEQRIADNPLSGDSEEDWIY